MRPHLGTFALAALATLSLSACTDQKELLSPHQANAYTVPYDRPPILVLDKGLKFVEITAGDYHTCARRQNGSVYCWGYDIDGQVGVQATETCGLNGGAGLCVRRPTYVSVSRLDKDGTVSTFTAADRVDAGSRHTCALDYNSKAWCWGNNYNGQVGRGTGIGGKALSPERVSGGLSFATLGAGADASCGSLTTGGVYCWGNRVYAPSFVASGGLTDIAVAGEHSCGNMSSNEWLCWGSNNKGQLAVDPAVSTSIPPYAWVHQIDGSPHVSVADGYTCADQSNGTVQCFGLNTVLDGSLVPVGLLGNPLFPGPYTHVLQTVVETTGGAPQLHGVTTSRTHACALDPNGGAWCWGIGDVGQLGNGARVSSTAPVRVTGGYAFRALAAGVDHTCGIGTDNHIYCWGDDYLGQLGLPTAPLYGVSTPVQALDP